MMIDVYCIDCGFWIDDGEAIHHNGIGPLCPDCNEIARLHEDEMKGLARDPNATIDPPGRSDCRR